MTPASDTVLPSLDHTKSLLFLCDSRVFSTGMCRWLSKDPIGERGGDNLYACGDNDLANKLDFLGLDGGLIRYGIDFKVGCCGGKIYWASSQCCCDGKTIIEAGPIESGVEVCTGYIKGNWIWGWIPSHAFLKCGDKGFGLYAVYAGSGPSGSGGIWNDPGYIDPQDIGNYPQVANPQDEQPYSKCSPIYLSPCEYDIKRFKECVCGYNQPSYSDVGYNILGWNCWSFVENAISHCKKMSKRRDCVR